MEDSAAIPSISSVASQAVEAEPDLRSTSSTGVALVDEVDFVASFMKALAQGVSKGKEDKDLIRQRKERKRQVNRASAKRKRARAKQDFDNLASQCQRQEESNRQLKNENARLAGVVRDELEKQAMYMAQIEYIKVALQQQQQQAASQMNSHGNSNDPGATLGAPLGAQPAPMTQSAQPPTPLLPNQSENQPTDGSSGASTQQMVNSGEPDLQQQLLQGELPSSESSEIQQQELPPQSSQQQLQALANFICASSMPSSQIAAGSAAPEARNPSNAVEAQSINQETLNQLQTLLSALVSQNPVAPSNPPATTPTAAAATVPPPVHNPLAASLGAMNPESAPQLNTLLNALVTASAALTGNSALGGQPMSRSTTQGSSEEQFPLPSQADADQGEPSQPC